MAKQVPQGQRQAGSTEERVTALEISVEAIHEDLGEIRNEVTRGFDKLERVVAQRERDTRPDWIKTIAIIGFLGGVLAVWQQLQIEPLRDEARDAREERHSTEKDADFNRSQIDYERGRREEFEKRFSEWTDRINESESDVKNAVGHMHSELSMMRTDITALQVQTSKE